MKDVVGVKVRNALSNLESKDLDALLREFWLRVQVVNEISARLAIGHDEQFGVLFEAFLQLDHVLMSTRSIEVGFSLRGGKEVTLGYHFDEHLLRGTLVNCLEGEGLCV